MRAFLFYSLLLTSLAGFAQKHTYTWYFGKKIGLDFNQSPPAVLSNGGISSLEGCASISDASGNLLFYTNGVVVLNKRHLAMTNGTNLLGDLSSTCNTVIVPLPGSTDIYYLFTVGSAGRDFQGLRYNIIDMNADNGLGAVTVKNELLNNNTYEKLAAVRHCNNRDVWIVIRNWNTDEYHSYLLTASGVQGPPVVSHTGLVIGGGELNSLGTLKFSPDGSKLAAVLPFDTEAVELMEFNRSTGVISNPQLFKPNTALPAAGFSGIYGAEFSPNNQFLYVSSTNSSTESAVLYQFNVTLMNSAAIQASRQIISVNQPWRAGALQAGPDNKIYFSMFEDTALSVIENPNLAGSACNFIFNKIPMPNPVAKPLQSGLPVFIAGDMYQQYVAYDFSITRTGDCNDPSARFTLNRVDGIDSVYWDFGDGEFSRELNPTHGYSVPGDFLVRLTIFKRDCSGEFHSISHNVKIGLGIDDISLPEDSASCSFTPYTITTAGSPNGEFLWNTGATTASLLITQPGLYWVDFSSNGCTTRDSFRYTLLSDTPLSLGGDTSMCSNSPVTIDAGSAFSSYLWSTGSTSRMIRVNEPGEFWLEAIDHNGCKSRDSIKVGWGDCGVYLASAFTPNGDGLNDKFGLINGFTATALELLVFNRYGAVVYRSSDFSKWDGSFNGKPQPMGLYPWLLIYRDKRNFRQTFKGTVLLIR